MKQWPWDKNKITNLPDPEGEKGGSDDQLGVASDAAAEAEADQNPYTPPLPVPLSRAVKREPGARGISEPAWLLNPPAALPGFGVVVGNSGQLADDSTDAAINTVRVDNLTRQWMYFPDVQVWVPPLWVGRVFRYNGSHNRRVRFETPAGMTALALSTSEVAAVTFYEEMLPEVDGEALPQSLIGLAGGVFADYSADALANTLVGQNVNARLEALNSAGTVERLRTSNTTGGSLFATGILSSAPALWNSASDYRPQASIASLGDAYSGAQVGANALVIFNSASYDRLRSASADALAATGILAVGSMGFSGGATPYNRFRLPNIFKQMASVAIAAGSAVTVWTPAAGLKPRLMGWVVSGTSGLVDAAVTFFETSTTGTFMGETGFIAGIQSPAFANYGPGGPIVSTSSAVIVAFSSTGLTLRGTLFGTEE